MSASIGGRFYAYTFRGVRVETRVVTQPAISRQLSASRQPFRVSTITPWYNLNPCHTTTRVPQLSAVQQQMKRLDWKYERYDKVTRSRYTSDTNRKVSLSDHRNGGFNRA